MTCHACTEDQLVEQPDSALFAELGWTTVSAMEEVFGAGGRLEDLPKAYSDELFRTKCNVLFEHVYEAYMGDGASVYSGGA